VSPRFTGRGQPWKAHDHPGDILAVLDAERVQRCFFAWVAALRGAPAGVIAMGTMISKTMVKSNASSVQPIQAAHHASH